MAPPHKMVEIDALRDPQLTVVYINLALYAFCYQMQQPVLPATVASLVIG